MGRCGFRLLQAELFFRRPCVGLIGWLVLSRGMACLAFVLYAPPKVGQSMRTQPWGWRESVAYKIVIFLATQDTVRFFPVLTSNSLLSGKSGSQKVVVCCRLGRCTKQNGLQCYHQQDVAACAALV